MAVKNLSGQYIKKTGGARVETQKPFRKPSAVVIENFPAIWNQNLCLPVIHKCHDSKKSMAKDD